MAKTPNSLTELKDILQEQGYEPEVFSGYLLEYNNCKISLAHNEWFIRTTNHNFSTNAKNVTKEVLGIINKQ